MRLARHAVQLVVILAIALRVTTAVGEEEARNSYLAVKGGGYFPTASNVVEAFGSVSGTSGTLPTGGDFEAAFGTAWGILGAQFAAGYMFTSNSALGMTGVPITGVLQLRLPLAFVVPYIEAGAGVFVITAKREATSQTDTNVSFLVPVGGGVDFLLGRVLLGVEARYLFSGKQTYNWANLPPKELNMSGVTLTANLGYRF